MMDINEIKSILPHRYPFLLVDKVLEIVEDQKIVAQKNVTVNEPFFQGHFPQEPIMPGVLQLEAIAQAGAIMMLKKEENKGKLAIFAGASNVKWRRKVIPGDVLTITVELVKAKGPFVFAKGEVRVEGELACQAEISCVLQ